ncbi:MAG: transcription termination factor Rho [Deltaproteobacteria bacterium]|nr:MAG: transcription termination factor Rho [Deltaproteobacteria bacterium]
MTVDLNELRTRPIAELVDAARGYGIDNAAGLGKQDLVFEVARRQAGAGARGEGVLEILADGFGFLRWADASFQPGPDDVYVSPSQIRRFNLRTGDTIRGRVRAPKEGERYFALIKIEAVNGRSPDLERDKLLFDNLTPVLPDARLDLGGPDAPMAARLVDLICPLGRGQRVALVAPPRAGRTRLLQDIAEACSGDPGLHVMLVLVDERPEEVVTLRRSVPAEVLATTVEEPAARHLQVVDMAMERARRLVEQGRDVVVLLDSLTRLARAGNAAAPAGGRLLRGVIDASALYRVRRTFALGRRLEEGGSLTVIAAVHSDTGARIDEVVADELSGLANAVIRLDGTAASQELWPAIDAAASWSRSTERFLDAGESAGRKALRAQLSGEPTADLVALLARLQDSPDNGVLVEEVLRRSAPVSAGETTGPQGRRRLGTATA